jgi:outer membrane protein assembly factor BamB
VYGGHGDNNGFPVCVELLTGKIAWKPGRGPGSGSAAVIYADGNLYFRYDDGVMALIEATPKEYRERGTFQIPDCGGQSWAQPVVANGRLYLREQDNLLCYKLKAR